MFTVPWFVLTETISSAGNTGKVTMELPADREIVRFCDACPIAFKIDSKKDAIR